MTGNIFFSHARKNAFAGFMFLLVFPASAFGICTSDCVYEAIRSVSCGDIDNGAYMGIQSCDAPKDGDADCHTWGPAKDCKITCDNGYLLTDAGTCAKPCSAGFTTLRISSGLIIPLYGTKTTTPAIGVKNAAGQKCYGSLEIGVDANALNVKTGSGANYRTVAKHDFELMKL